MRLERKRESDEEKIEVEGEAGTTGRPERDRPNRIAQAVREEFGCGTMMISVSF